ncbi:MAG: hypothetical protein WAW63_05035 [Candidatus Saccharimonadales bacterium]|jgi:ABC-type transporter Mla subunit MlaD|nr:hypothetical protein [Candidatus Saccharibacteria bacterium]
MSQDEFKKLFQYIEGFRTEVSQQFEANNHKQDETIAAIAELGGHLRDYHAELLALSSKVDRLERWIQQVAQVTGVQLQY